jgi:FKBP-type peptidyl-prolyl cis-trans isomerase 2
LYAETTLSTVVLITNIFDLLRRCLNLLLVQPFAFAVGLGQVIKGWDESVIDMSLGEVAKIHCTPDYA